MGKKKNQPWPKLLIVSVYCLCLSLFPAQIRASCSGADETQRSPITQRQCPKPILEHTCVPGLAV